MSSVNLVKLVADYEDPNQLNGLFVPQRVYSDVQNSAILHIDSEDQLEGTENGFNFTVDLKTQIINCRSIKLSSINMPLLPQINDKNNVVTITHDTGTGSITLDNGYYTVQSLVNMLNSKFTSLWTSINVLNTVTVFYDSDKRRIEVIDGNGDNFYFDPNCSFIKYAINVVQFPSGSSSNSTQQNSTSLQMIYSRYCVVYSKNLTQHSRLQSRSTCRQQMNIIGLVDLVEGYTSEQWVNSSAFPTTSKLFKIDDSPVINQLNKDQKIRIIDILIEDEFGNCVYDIYNSGFKYSTYMKFMMYF